MLSSLICLVGGAGDLVGDGDCWDEQASQVQSLFLRYWAAFRIPEHLDHLLRVHTGQGYFVAGPGFGCTSPDICRSFRWVWSGCRRCGFVII